jgi:hypothetical protein
VKPDIPWPAIFDEEFVFMLVSSHITDYVFLAVQNNVRIGIPAWTTTDGVIKYHLAVVP